MRDILKINAAAIDVFMTDNPAPRFNSRPREKKTASPDKKARRIAQKNARKTTRKAK